MTWAVLYMLVGVVWFLVTGGPRDAEQIWGAQQLRGARLVGTFLILVALWPVEIAVLLWRAL